MTFPSIDALLLCRSVVCGLCEPNQRKTALNRQTRLFEQNQYAKRIVDKADSDGGLEDHQVYAAP